MKQLVRASPCRTLYVHRAAPVGAVLAVRQHGLDRLEKFFRHHVIVRVFIRPISEKLNLTARSVIQHIGVPSFPPLDTILFRLGIAMHLYERE